MNKFQRFKQGLKDLTPVQLLRAQYWGNMGACFGIVFGTFFLVINGMWYFTVLLFFVFWLQVVQLISSKQKYDVALKTERFVSEEEQRLKQILEEE